MDTLSQLQRSRLMRSVNTRNTGIEMRVRSVLHAAGFRFSLHKKSLPGTPDILLPRHRVAVFVHGCFWHGHDCSRGKRPSTNVAFWQEKLDRNIERDQQDRNALKRLGWRVYVVWGCDIEGNTKRLIKLLKHQQAQCSTSIKSRKVSIKRTERRDH
ncbi:MAG TPA: very short patch repair endonuclease [Bryobacteraceae bacterium]|nr:very short patch repair endonuclease [Bryobacteraceae bacterium]